MLSAIFGKRGSPAWEISFVIACVLASEWLAPLFFGKSLIAGVVPALLAVTFIVLSQISKGETLAELGWTANNFVRACLLLTPLMMAATVVLVAIGWYCGSLQSANAFNGPALMRVVPGLFVWGLVQQYPLQSFINRRAQEIWGPGTASVLFVAAAFALLHLPNLWLMAATFFGGLMWSYVYQRAPNLWAVGLSHAIMTGILAMTVPYPALHGLRVGYNYFR